MARRSRISRRTSKRIFRRTGSMTHKRNVSAGPMRGGIRL